MIDKTKWKNIEKNIWQNIENPKKFMLILYYGRDARGRMKKSSKTMYGTLTEARNMLKRHDVEFAVNLAFWCACRREEACALKWENVNFKDRTIKICEVRTTAMGKVEERNTTKNGVVRKVGMVEWLENILLRETSASRR